MSSSNCCFLTCIQISQEGGQVVWYSHLFQNFPQFIVIHTIKGFGIVNKAEVDVFLKLSCFFIDPADVGNLISFLKPAWTSGSSRFRYCWRLAGEFWASLWTKLVEVMEFQLSCFKSWKMMLWKRCTQYASKFGKVSSGHKTGKGQFSFQSQRKAMSKNAQITAQLHSSHMLVK